MQFKTKKLLVKSWYYIKWEFNSWNINYNWFSIRYWFI